MDFLQTSEGRLFVGVAVGLVAVGASAYFIFSSKKSKGLSIIMIYLLTYKYEMPIGYIMFLYVRGCIF